MRPRRGWTVFIPLCKKPPYFLYGCESWPIGVSHSVTTQTSLYLVRGFIVACLLIEKQRVKWVFSYINNWVGNWLIKLASIFQHWWTGIFLSMRLYIFLIFFRHTTVQYLREVTRLHTSYDPTCFGTQYCKLDPKNSI